jgi:hypothetical protein
MKVPSSLSHKAIYYQLKRIADGMDKISQTLVHHQLSFQSYILEKLGQQSFPQPEGISINKPILKDGLVKTTPLKTKILVQMPYLLLYEGKPFPKLRNQIEKLLVKILEKISDKAKDTYITRKDIAKMCGWDMADYPYSAPERNKLFENKVSGVIRELNQILKSVGAPQIKRYDQEKGYFCSVVLNDITIKSELPSHGRRGGRPHTPHPHAI